MLKEWLATLVLLAYKGHQVRKEKRVQLGTQHARDLLDLLEFQVRKEIVVLLGDRDLPVLQDHMALEDHEGHQVRMESQDFQDLEGYQVRKEIVVKAKGYQDQVTRGHQDQVTRGHQD